MDRCSTLRILSEDNGKIAVKNIAEECIFDYIELPPDRSYCLAFIPGAMKNLSIEFTQIQD